MIYDPRALPFWEIERGDGPYTRLMIRRAYTEKRFRENPQIRTFERVSTPVMPQGCSWKRPAQNEIPDKMGLYV